jgi:hypothetical protein
MPEGGAQRARRVRDHLDHAEPPALPGPPVHRSVAPPPGRSLSPPQRPGRAAGGGDQPGHIGSGGAEARREARGGRRLRARRPVGPPAAARRGPLDRRDRHEHGHGVSAQRRGRERDLRRRLAREHPHAGRPAPGDPPDPDPPALRGPRRDRRGRQERQPRGEDPRAGPLPARARGPGAGGRCRRGVRGGRGRGGPRPPGAGRHRRGPRGRQAEGPRPALPAHHGEHQQHPHAAGARRDGAVDARPAAPRHRDQGRGPRGRSPRSASPAGRWTTPRPAAPQGYLLIPRPHRRGRGATEGLERAWCARCAAVRTRRRRRVHAAAGCSGDGRDRVPRSSTRGARWGSSPSKTSSSRSWGRIEDEYPHDGGDLAPRRADRRRARPRLLRRSTREEGGHGSSPRRSRWTGSRLQGRRPSPSSPWRARPSCRPTWVVGVAVPQWESPQPPGGVV